MEYNLLKQSIITYNTISGTIGYDYYTTASLVDVPYSSNLHIDAPNILYINIDLLNRTAVNYFYYYYTTLSGSSEFHIRYKNYSPEPYIDIEAISGTESGNVIMFEDTPYSYPRYIEIVHSVISGTILLNGILLTNESSTLLFGEDGLLSSAPVTAAIGASFVKEIPIYNNSDTINSVNVQIEPSNYYIDNYISIGLTDNGPWVQIYDIECPIVKQDSFAYGDLSQGSSIESSVLSIAGDTTYGVWASDKEVATYTTPIFKSNNVYSTLFIDYYNKDLGCRLCTDDTDSEETIEVKIAKLPIDYNIYRKIWSVYKNIYMSDYDLTTDALIQAVTTGLEGHDIGYLSTFMSTFNTQGYCSAIIGTTDRVQLILFDFLNTIKYSRVLVVASNNNAYIYHVCPDFGGGTWLYIYTNVGSTSYPLSQTGYFFIHYDNSNVLTFKASSNTRDIYVFSVVPGGSDVWYSSSKESSIIKINITGVVLYSYFDSTYTNSVRGCVSIEDGGCWFINGNDLHRLSNAGFLIDSVFGVTNSNLLSYILYYPDNTVIVRDGDIIKKIILSGSEKGRIVFSKTIAYADKLIYDTEMVWVYCTTGFTYGLSINSGEILKTIGTSITDSSVRVYGIFRKDFISSMNTEWVTKFPTPTDNEWALQPYNKVDMSTYLLPYQYYYQVRIALRANKPYNKYSVPYSIREWDPNDDFSVESSYSTPYEHRWQLHNKILINSVSGTCDLYCGEADPINNPHVYLYSNDRWFIKGEVNGNDVGTAYDLQIDFILPPMENGDVTFYIAVTPNNNDLDYIRAVLRRVGATMTLQLVADQASFYWGGTASSILTITPLQNEGKLRIVKNNARTCYAYFYSYISNTWVSTAVTLDNGAYHRTMDYAQEKNWNVRIDAAGGGIVTVDNFIVNKAIVYWLMDSPKIRGIYLQNYVTVPDIYPKNYKSIYIKTQLPQEYTDYIPNSSYSYNLRAWWNRTL